MDDTFFLILIIIFFSFCFITAAFSLTIILIFLCHWRGQFQSLTNLLTCNSCVATLYHSLAASNEILIVIISRGEETMIHPSFCKLSAAIYFSASLSIEYSYLCQAISRYFITNRSKNLSLLTFRTHYHLILLLWSVTFSFAGLMLFSPSAYQYEMESRMCLLTSKVFHTSFVAIMTAFCTPLVIIIVLYGLIIRQTTRTRNVQINFNANNIRTRRNIKAFQIILLFVTIMLVGGSPYSISVIINRISSLPTALYSLSILLMSASTMLESIAFFFTNKQIIRFVRIKFRIQPTGQSSKIVIPPRQNQVMPRLAVHHMTKDEHWFFRFLIGFVLVFSWFKFRLNLTDGNKFSSDFFVVDHLNVILLNSSQHRIKT